MRCEPDLYLMAGSEPDGHRPEADGRDERKRARYNALELRSIPRKRGERRLVRGAAKSHARAMAGRKLRMSVGAG